MRLRKWSRKSQDRILRNGVHLFQSSSQSKRKVMRLPVPDTCDRLPIQHSDSGHHKNVHAHRSQPLLPSVKQLQLSVAMQGTREFQQPSKMRAGSNPGWGWTRNCRECRVGSQQRGSPNILFVHLFNKWHGSNQHSLFGENYARSLTVSSPYPGHRFPRGGTRQRNVSKISSLFLPPILPGFWSCPTASFPQYNTQNHLKLGGKTPAISLSQDAESMSSIPPKVPQQAPKNHPSQPPWHHWEPDPPSQPPHSPCWLPQKIATTQFSVQ